MFTGSERDLPPSPKLLLVGGACVAISALLSRWLSIPWAVGFGFIPFYALLEFAGRPLSYKRWFMAIGLMVLALTASAMITTKMIMWMLPSLGLRLLSYLLSYLYRRKQCPKCRGRLKYLPRHTEGERVQCVMCERVWLKGRGWALHPASPAVNEKVKVWEGDAA